MTEVLFKMKPTSCTLLLSIFISTSLHVSGNDVPIIRRTYCICATLVFFTACGRLVCYVPIIRSTYCVYATLLFFVLYGWLSGLLCAQHQENLLHLCDTGIFRSVRVAVWSADQTATRTVSSLDDGHIVTRNM